MIDLLSHFRSRQGSILDDIRSLVEIESPTTKPEGTTRITSYFAEQYESIGATVRLYPTEHGAHLVARANLDAPASAGPIMLLGHVDTVWPTGTFAEYPFRVEDGKAFGPGIFDMKSGTVLMLEVIRAIKDFSIKLSHPTVVFLSCDEESGGITSRTLIEAEARNCSGVLVLEPPLPGGVLKTERKGISSFQIKTHGVPSHAGLDPEKGVSAIAEMAHQILELHKMNDLAAGISVNVGVVNGGTYSNVVAAEAVAEVDVRYRTRLQAQEITERIKQLRPVVKGGTIEVISGLSRPPLERTADVISLFEKAKQVAAGLGFELREGSVGGGSDGNFTAALGIPTLDGLGVDGNGAHAKHEHIVIDDIPRRAALLTGLLSML
ncbi:MAG TPA: M20 family metallopeptidase [Blastocatellia bacterium]|nr:M20 family metallopeptidase [Blastocatellia bacterium]